VHSDDSESMGTPRMILLAATAAGLLARAWVVWHAPGHSLAVDQLFDTLAWNLVSLHEFTLDGLYPSAHVGPLYPAILASFYVLVGHRPEWVPFLHILFDLGTAWSMYGVGTALWGVRVGAWAAALVFLYPAYWIYDSRIRSEALLTFLMSVWLMTTIACNQAPSAYRYARMGFMAALTILCKPVVLVLALLLPAFVWNGTKHTSTRIAYVVVYSVTCLALVLPWSIRNYAVFHHVIPVSAGVGAGLWMGSDPVSRGSWPMPLEREQMIWESAGITPLPYAHAMYDVRTDQALREKGMNRIAADPLGYVGLTFTRVWDFWVGNSFYLVNGQEGLVEGFRSDAAERGWMVALYSMLKRLLLVPGLMVVAMLSAWIHRTRRQDLLPLYVFPLGLTAGYAPFTVEAGRYALPVLPCLLVLAVALIPHFQSIGSSIVLNQTAFFFRTPSMRYASQPGKESMSPVVLAELAGSSGYGGGERYLELLFDRMDPTRFAPLLICPESGPFVGKMTAKGIPTSVVHLAPLFNPLALVRLAYILKREGVTILQTHGARANVYGRLAAWLAGVPCVVSTVHNSLRDYDVSPVKRWIYRLLLRITLPLADRVICVSDALKRDVLADCPGAASKTTTVWNGIDSALFSSPRNRGKIRKEWCVGSGPALLTVARLTEQKGHRFLIEALPGLLAEWPSLVCLFVGEGECREELRALARERGVEQSCRFAGAREDVVNWYAAADVVVLPSLSEGFPFVILEALALARPVVATDVNGVPEIIHDGRTGLLVLPRNSQALETAIRKMLREPSWAERVGKTGQQEVAARFTAEKMVQDTVNVLADAMPALRHSPSIAQRDVRKQSA
jgi:glycosyltransferase involved in cell wall biosynthesis/4-amino-4-deoxy-L-arabinose transferase-like glycosyltransferase